MRPETRERLMVAMLSLDLAVKRVRSRRPARAEAVVELVERSMRMTIEALEKLTAHVSGELRGEGSDGR